MCRRPKSEVHCLPKLHSTGGQPLRDAVCLMSFFVPGVCEYRALSSFVKRNTAETLRKQASKLCVMAVAVSAESAGGANASFCPGKIGEGGWRSLAGRRWTKCQVVKAQTAACFYT